MKINLISVTRQVRMIAQGVTISSVASPSNQDVDSSYCSDDDSSSSSSSNSVTILTSFSSVNYREVRGSEIINNQEGCKREGRNHGQGRCTSVTRSSDVNEDDSFNKNATGSDTDGEYDCDTCPATISSFSKNETMSSKLDLPPCQPKMINRSRCHSLPCQTPLLSIVNCTGSSMQSPCTTWMSSSSRSLSRLSPCSISGLEINVLHQLIPEDIMYRGEGNSSLVVSLTKEGKVIRILKDGKKSSSSSLILERQNKLPVDFNGKNGDENYNSSNIPTISGTSCIKRNDGQGDSCCKDLVQQEVEKIIEERLIDIIDFNRHVMKRILNHCFLDEPQLVSLNKSQVEVIDRVASVCRPGHRLHKSIPLRDTYALLLPDYCSIQQLVARCSINSAFLSQILPNLVGPVISVEIKPKQGFLPSIESLPSDLTIKSSICRFCLKQFYKMKKGNVSGISSYCPLDLFSGCIDRQYLALKSLIDTPQNNFRIFKDLIHVYGDGTSIVTGSPQESLNEDKLSEILQDFIAVNQESGFGGNKCGIQNVFCNLLLKSLIHPFMDPQGDPKVNDCDMVINIEGSTTCDLHLDHRIECSGSVRCRSRGHSINGLSVLGSVYSAQRLDSVDSYRALEMARYLNERHPNFMEELKSKHRRPTKIGSPERLSTESLEEFFFRKVWEYIVSLTAKDCSIMITMQRINHERLTEIVPLKPKSSPRGFAIIQDDLTKGYYLVTTSITDLDPKLPATFADLERKIKEKDYLMVASYNENHI